MRRENIILMIFCLVAVAGIGYLLNTQTSPKAAFEKWSKSVASRGEMSRTEDPAPVETPKAEAPKKVNVKVAAVVKPAEEAAPAPVVAPVVEAVAAPVSQPEPGDISTGMKRSALLERFPGPAIQASTLRDGSLMELMVYQKKDAPLATYAQLENGAVTRVYAGIPARRVP